MIPDWTMDGIVPPIRPGLPGYSDDRSPYRVGLVDFIDRFAVTADRAAVLDGFLTYRAELHGLGVVNGFQWLNGSFLEHVEDTEGRSPRDIDVVTFFEIPPGQNQQGFFGAVRHLFDINHCKQTYSVDGYPHVLGESLDERNVRQISYWYSMWSHRRNGVWKGFVQVDLNPANDVDARMRLENIVAGGL